MSRKVLTDWSHPVLGTFERSAATNHLGQTSVDLEKRGPTEVSGLGFVFNEFSIYLREISEPPQEMLEDLVTIVQWPRSRLGEIEDALFKYYVENRDSFIEEYGEDLGADEVARCIPSIQHSSEVWKLIVGALYIAGGTWERPSIAFNCLFDEEHELHISFHDNRVHEVWNE